MRDWYLNTTRAGWLAEQKHWTKKCSDPVRHQKASFVRIFRLLLQILQGEGNIKLFYVWKGGRLYKNKVCIHSQDDLLF